ncbi:SCO4848 family membrane protein [Demequina sp. NBRC 110056]|uniref:SCO4848 family membrane protein n=1 Tax=Demequina sp. NBRC 110056 TaxID=1570345 RepID=UPI0009FF0E6B|nr:hypothetical protein [Demequina sp. NBRC 110056]
MVLTLSIVLLVNALFAFAVWPRFMKRIAADERSTDDAGARTRFYTVHLVLITTALVLAAVSLVAGVAGLVSLG